MSPTLPPENSPEKGDPAPRKHSESAHSGADSQHSDRKYRSSKFAQQLHGPVGAEVVPESAIFPHGSAADSEAIERRRVAAAERQRRHRHRMAHALCAWKIDVDIIAIDRLIERGPLSEQDVDNRHAIELALSRLVADALKLKFGSYVLDSPSVVLVNTPEPPVKSAKRRKQVLQKNPKNNPNN